MTCAAPDARKPLVILRRQSTKATGTFVYTKTNLRTNPGLWRTILTKTAAGFSENPDSTDNLVRDIEESGYPVDGANQTDLDPLPPNPTVRQKRPLPQLKNLSGADAIGRVSNTALAGSC